MRRPPTPCSRCGGERIRRGFGVISCPTCESDPNAWAYAGEEALAILTRAVPSTMTATIILRERTTPDGAGDVLLTTETDMEALKTSLAQLMARPAMERSL